ncbi:MAG TPA: hypothetical protein VIV06_00170 [Candidatus Limnocylindrales bacterium]
MTRSMFAAIGAPGPRAAAAGYRPGICNIGPAEIAARRRAGHVGVIGTIVLLVLLVVSGAPPRARLIVALPAAAAASGYLQAWLRFCAGFGARGVFNFGPLGQAQPVEEAEARKRDRARSMLIGLASLAIGVTVGAVAVLVPG